MSNTRATIAIGAKDETGPAFSAVQRSIQKLQVAAATTGKSAADTKLYSLAVQGASAAQLEAARSAIKLSDGYARGAAMIAMTTITSISVKPRMDLGRELSMPIN